MFGEIMQTAGQCWAEEYPAVAAVLHQLVCQGVGVGISFSSYSYAVAKAQGRDARVPDDIDLLVPDKYIPYVQSAIGATRVKTQKKMMMLSADGRTITFTADEYLGVLGGKTVQFMGRKSAFSITSERVKRDFSITENMMHMRCVVETSHGLVPFIHPVDTILAWAIFQRGGAKNDAESIAVLSSLYKMQEDRYFHARITEMGLGARELNFLHRNRVTL